MHSRQVFRRVIIILCGWLGFAHTLSAQEDPGEKTIFPLEALYERVLEYHPQLQQAGLLTEEAKMLIREARGAFDPKLVSEFEQKYFNDKEYFTVWKSELKIPTLINTDLKVGYEQNSGIYLNPQNKLPEAGLVYAGISVPLGQGLLTDSRRTALRVAQLETELAEAERVKLINKFLYEAAKDYWTWALAYQQLRLNEEGVELARFRFEGIRESVFVGDLAPIDSVEAAITVQSREIEYLQSKLEYKNALLQLAVYLWTEEGEPLLPQAGIAPEELVQLVPVPLQAVEELMSLVETQHPDLRKLQAKIEQLEVEERLYRELLKPVVDLQYNYLRQPEQVVVEEIPLAFSENYKLGVNFAFPLLLRKERAKLQLNRIKQKQTFFALHQRQRELSAGLEQAYNEYLNLKRLLVAQQTIVRDYQRLQEGEIEKFEAGESSLFLVNQRENKLLEARQKLLELAAKYQKARAAVLWSAGLSVSGELTEAGL
ncbi:TolC family protein [Nafulsella turpanensis]|uniref:TolC family protein n=1 Tax=Nafulsella turpanensis TaxID=1265690 RepID=UPI000347244E|nr:TolC family protein [Nafulsella turpanensis]